MSQEKIIELLLSNKATHRRKAAKEIGEDNHQNFSDLLFQVFIKENESQKSWETIVQMILSLGLVNHKPALNIITKIIEKNKPHDMITYAAAQTYVRLKRESISDISPILDLLEFGGLSIVDGALTPLAYDKMQPTNDDIKILLSLCWNLHKHKDRIGFEYGYTDPRYALAAACAYWNKSLTMPFLNHCIETANTDSSLIYVAKAVLQGKKPKLR
jgi:hypothetical protein